MNKKEFKEALLRGQGRCILAAREDPARYRDVVLWACRHEVAFDHQCEGSKAWFVYQLIGCYEDKRPFLETLVAELDKARSDGSWKLVYLAELLSHFAGEGQAALWRKYESLYNALRGRKRYPRRIFHELSDFDMLCDILAEDKQTMARIAEDIGRLYRENLLYDGSNVDGPYFARKRWQGTLEKMARKSENIAAYLQGVAEEDARIAAFRADRPRQSGEEDVRAHVKAYLDAQDPEARAEALSVFGRRPYPDDPAPIMADTGSDYEPLSRRAWLALENIRHPAVRTWALAQMEVNEEDAWPVFLTNYEDADEPRLTRLVESVPVDFACTTDWHGIQLDIINMERRGRKAPAHLLRRIYETSYCACCREHALRQMGRRHLLTNAILEEAVFDSYAPTRDYAARCLKRRKRACGTSD